MIDATDELGSEFHELGEDALDAVPKHPVLGQRRLARRINFGEVVKSPRMTDSWPAPGP